MLIDLTPTLAVFQLYLLRFTDVIPTLSNASDLKAEPHLSQTNVFISACLLSICFLISVKV